MYMEKFLKKLGINNVGYYNKSGTYVIDLENSNQYGRVYSILDKCNDIEEIDDESELTLHSSRIVYESDKYKFSLIADFDKDFYKLTCNEILGDD